MTTQSQTPQNPAPKPETKKSLHPLWVVGGCLSLMAVISAIEFRRPSTVAPSNAVSGEATSSEAAPEDKPAAPIAVEVSTAVLRPIETLVSAKGTLVAAQGASAKVAVAAPARLARVLVSEGDRVAAGQVIAVVDNRSARAEARSVQANLAASQADARGAELGVLAAQSDQFNALRQAQLGLGSALAEREGSVRQAQIALRSAQSDLRKTQIGARARDVSSALQSARLGLRSAQIERDTNIKAARNALQSVQTDLAKLRAGARPQEIKQAEAAVVQAGATRDRAATEVERVQFLFDRGIKARRELDDAQTALRVADAGLKSAGDALSLLRAGTRTEDLRAGELRVAGARETLGAARASGNAKVVEAQAALQLAQSNLGQAALSRPEDVRAATLRVRSAGDALRQAGTNGAAKVAGARAALQAAQAGRVQIAAKTQDARAKQALARSKQADLQNAQIAALSGELRAPLSGVVSKRNLNPGDMADPATPVLEISNGDTLNLLANLPDDAGAGVQQGMTARVSLDGAPNRVFAGRVVSVGQIDPQTNLLSVRVAVPNRSGALRVGAFATADIVVATKPLAVVVPKSALLSRDEKSVVLVAGSDGKAHQKTVTTGTERGELVEITRGLRPGERVIGAGGFQLDDGAPIVIAAPGTLAGEGETGDSTGADGATGADSTGAGAASTTPATGADSTGTTGTSGADATGTTRTSGAEGITAAGASKNSGTSIIRAGAAGTSAAGASGAGTSGAGTSGAGTSGAGTTQSGTSTERAGGTGASRPRGAAGTSGTAGAAVNAGGAAGA